MEEMKEEKAQEVEARVIERDLADPTEYERWIAGMREEVQGQLSNFGPHDITSADDYRQSGRDRKAARAIIAKWDGQRKEATSRYRKLLSDIKSDVDAALQPLYDADAGYKAALDEWDERAIEDKLAELAQHYEDMAPDLVSLVPFAKLDEVYGSAEKWHLKSTNIQRMKQQLEAHVSGIADDERTIDELEMTDGERTALKAEYFSSLDLGTSLSHAIERREQRERVEQLEAERRERERQQREAEAHAQRAEELAAAKRAHEADAAIETGSVVTPDEFERTRASIEHGATWQEPEPAAEPEPEPQPEMWHVVLDLGTMDAEKLDEVKQVLRTTGIKEALHGIGAECRLMRGRA